MQTLEIQKLNEEKLDLEANLENKTEEVIRKYL